MKFTCPSFASCLVLNVLMVCGFWLPSAFTPVLAQANLAHPPSCYKNPLDLVKDRIDESLCRKVLNELNLISAFVNEIAPSRNYTTIDDYDINKALDGEYSNGVYMTTQSGPRKYIIVGSIDGGQAVVEIYGNMLHTQISVAIYRPDKSRTSLFTEMFNSEHIDVKQHTPLTGSITLGGFNHQRNVYVKPKEIYPQAIRELPEVRNALSKAL
jgi:hypothetical protein